MKKIILISILFCAQAYAGQLLIWGETDDPNTADPNIPWHPDNKDYTDISAYSHYHFLALRSDGTLVDWLFEPYGCLHDLCLYPDTNDFVKIAAGNLHSIALRKNGSLTAWGNNGHGQCDVPDGNFVDIATGGPIGLAIKADGSLAQWGYDIGATPAGNNYVDISVGASACYALDSNGIITAWGQNNYHECDVPPGNYSKVSAGMYFCLALNEDGVIIGWGKNDYGLCNTPIENDFIDVATGWHHGLAVRIDGTLVAWGDNNQGQCDVPDGNDFVAVAAGGSMSMAITSDSLRTLTMTTSPPNMDCVSPSLGETGYYSGQTIFVNAPRCPDCPNVYKFDHWEGDVADVNSPLTTLTMDSDKTIRAVYKADQKFCGDECHPILTGDLNEDCYINFEDFAIYTQNWMECTHPDCD